ncbi:EAL and HDOD domain-containing protein [Oceanospirillum sp.]|uniref:EAL and HDOD domain-containing protein n=1 Tax=Oceanospirillum sp. TaxID=2021254 RepID=UPI003A8CAFCD
MGSLNQLCITRLTFCDSDLIRRGFELTYHDTQHTANSLEVSAKVASFTLLDYGLDQAGESGKVLLTITKAWLPNASTLPAAKIQDRLVLQLDEDISPDPITLNALHHIRSKGFQVALTNYTINDPRKALLSEVDIVKINCQKLMPCDLKRLYAELKGYSVALMAGQIENWQMFEQVRAAGFDLYQGSFLGKPELLDTPKNSTNRILLVKLMTLLFDDKSSIQEIEKVIEQEPTLFYRLLKFVNSAAYQLPNKIDSLHQAVIYIGTETLRTLVAILVWAKDDHKAYTVLPQILTRAKSCELLAKELGLAPSERYFTLGFLSMLDVALDQPLDKLILSLSLPEEMQNALLKDEGSLAEVLNFVRQWEKANWEILQQNQMFSSESTPELMQQAQHWAQETEKEMQNI